MCSATRDDAASTMSPKCALKPFTSVVDTSPDLLLSMTSSYVEYLESWRAISHPVPKSF